MLGSLMTVSHTTRLQSWGHKEESRVMTARCARDTHRSIREDGILLLLQTTQEVLNSHRYLRVKKWAFSINPGIEGASGNEKYCQVLPHPPPSLAPVLDHWGCLSPRHLSLFRVRVFTLTPSRSHCGKRKRLCLLLSSEQNRVRSALVCLPCTLPHLA